MRLCFAGLLLLGVAACAVPTDPPPPALDGRWDGGAETLRFMTTGGEAAARFTCDRDRGRLTVEVAGSAAEGTSRYVLVTTDNGGGFAAPIAAERMALVTGRLDIDGPFQLPFASATTLRVAIGSLDPAPRFLPATPEVQLLLSTCP